MSIINSGRVEPAPFASKVAEVKSARIATYAEDNSSGVLTGPNGTGGMTNNCAVSLQFTDGSTSDGFLAFRTESLDSPVEVIWKSLASIESDSFKQEATNREAPKICDQQAEKANASRLIGVPASSLMSDPRVSHASTSSVVCTYIVGTGLMQMNFEAVFVGVDPKTHEPTGTVNVMQVPTGTQSLYELTPPLRQ